MNSNDPTVDFNQDLSARKRIHEKCEQFIAAWKNHLSDNGVAVTRPDIQAYLDACPDSPRRELFGDLLDAELYYRRKQGETPTSDDYHEHFPEMEQIIHAAFSESAGSEQPKPVGGNPDAQSRDTPRKARRLQIRCPHCHESIKLPIDAKLSDIECSSCNSSFSVVDDVAETQEAEAVAQVAHFDLIDRLGMGSLARSGRRVISCWTVPWR